MLTLGLSGGLDPVHDDAMDAPENYTYDGAAVLLDDGRVVAAVEEERLNRIKHSNKFPVEAIRFCLARYGARIDDVHRIAYYVEEEAANELLARLYLTRPDIERPIDARTLFARALRGALGRTVDPARLCFFPHRLTHAMSALAHSGFSDSLVVVLDNVGGVFVGCRGPGGRLQFDLVAALPPSKSLQRLAQAVFPFLGLGVFGEYKAMALAPYGDPGTYAPLVSSLYALGPNGDYSLHLDRIALLMGKIEPRRRHQDFSQAHKDLAASLQHAMEVIVLHVLQHYRQVTGQRNLCMAGGMVENTSTNGRVLDAGLFDRVFVPPAAYDSGCALGAALLAATGAGVAAPSEPLPDAFWGPHIGDSSHVAAELARWQGFVSVDTPVDVAGHAAALIAAGAVLGWVQDRSEFGSHALGHRTVVADPRPAHHRERVNRALGRSEPYRPFALAVLEEDATQLFELPAEPAAFRFAAFAARVREYARLGATTHVDGSARVQTVSRATNPAFWALLHAFKELTGVPAVLTASLNSGAEPAADSVEDAIVTFLTTEVDHLVVGQHVAEKRTPTWEDRGARMVSLPRYARVLRLQGLVERTHKRARYEIRTSYDATVRRVLSTDVGQLLSELYDGQPAAALLSRHANDLARQQALMAELEALWSERLIVMCPGPRRRDVV